MATSIYLARLIGPVLAVLGLSMLLQPGGYLAVVGDLIRSPALLYFACALGLLGGVALVLAHNIWRQDWPVLITLLGWISIIDSTTWILLPRQAAQLWLPLMGTTFALIGGLIVLLAGAALSYFGYAEFLPSQSRPTRRRSRRA
jgi:hypothetical protein